MARANNLKNSGVPDDIFQLDDLSVLVCRELLCVYFSLGWMKYFSHLSAKLQALFNFM